MKQRGAGQLGVTAVATGMEAGREGAGAQSHAARLAICTLMRVQNPGIVANPAACTPRCRCRPPAEPSVCTPVSGLVVSRVTCSCALALSTPRSQAWCHSASNSKSACQGGRAAGWQGGRAAGQQDAGAHVAYDVCTTRRWCLWAPLGSTLHKQAWRHICRALPLLRSTPHNRSCPPHLRQAVVGTDDALAVLGREHGLVPAEAGHGRLDARQQGARPADGARHRRRVARQRRLALVLLVQPLYCLKVGGVRGKGGQVFCVEVGAE